MPLHKYNKAKKPKPRTTSGDVWPRKKLASTEQWRLNFSYCTLLTPFLNYYTHLDIVYKGK